MTLAVPIGAALRAGAAGDSVVIYSVAKGDAGWLDGAFSAGDLMMVSTLSRS